MIKRLYASAYIPQWLVSALLAISLALLPQTQHLRAANQDEMSSTHAEILQLVDTFKAPEQSSDSGFISDSLQVSGCDDYPYHNNDQPQGVAQLVKDLQSGLQQGLMCLTGQGPMGKLHPYHETQALRLMFTLQNDQTKSLQCVRDELFAYAMAASSQQRLSDPALVKKIKNSPALTILLDTYRIGGLLSQKFEPDTYKVFFKLDNEEINQHLTGKPLRMKGVKRYENLPALLFHEMIHWLGHTHTNINPDITFLYETCCFGGSEFIDDAQTNQDFQAKACEILKDDELWSAHPYQKMRLWKHKQYDQLKRDIRANY